LSPPGPETGPPAPPQPSSIHYNPPTFAACWWMQTGTCGLPVGQYPQEVRGRDTASAHPPDPGAQSLLQTTQPLRSHSSSRQTTTPSQASINEGSAPTPKDPP
jgi:hypothetical protein